MAVDMARSADPVLQVVAHDAGLRALIERADRPGTVHASGVSGSSAHIAAFAIAQACAPRAGIVVVAHLDDADHALDEAVARGLDAVRLPALEVLPGESGASMELFVERAEVVRRLTSNTPPLIIAPIQALMQGIPSAERLAELMLELAPGTMFDPLALAEWLGESGYRRLDAVQEPGEFAVRGDIVDVFPAGAADDEGAVPFRLDFFGDEIESIREIDLATGGSDRALERVQLVRADAADVLAEGDLMPVLDLLPDDAIAVLLEPLEAAEQGRGYFERVTDARGIFGPPAVFKALAERDRTCVQIHGFSAPDHSAEVLPARPAPEFDRDAETAIGELAELAKTHRAVVCCQNEGEAERLNELLREFAPGAEVETRLEYLHRGFVWGEEESTEHPLLAVPHHELFHRYQTRRRIRKLRGGRATDAFLELAPGDYVVHADHGIAKFIGLRRIKPKAPKATADTKAQERIAAARGKRTGDQAASEEFLTLEFSGRAKLHVPVAQIDRVQRYVGGSKGAPPLSTIGGKRWQTQKEQVKDSVRELAGEMLRVQAARSATPGTRFPADTAWQREFEAEFPYEETDDQLAAIGEVKKDMARTQPMDRLICGDVGFGKTEVAIRAAFKAAEFGRQVAVLVPTTLLCEQHERTFRSRFASYPFRVESLSRFKSRGEQNEILKAVRKGQVDIVIGTHRLLSKDVKFADLGLVVVDEEQRFGVEHKQRLLQLRLTADVLTLSATPIPRTLHMSMLGLRDISSLTTAPLDRRAIVTEVIPYNETRIKRAIERELAREGQVYFIHNRVHNIKTVADDVRRLVPDARIGIGHGQMPEGELEEVMRAFTNRELDILVATTIVESGIDIPTANTMIINGADMFGLAELHQLRGRVGRYKHRAYCYLLLPKDRPVNEVAVKRLRAIEEFSMLGAGFRIAMRDLEIRGAGNLLGAEQSGHIAAVGYEMYCQLLEQATRELRGEPTAKPSETTVEIGVTAAIPANYIPSEARRIDAYRRIASVRTIEELEKAEADLVSAYGEAPPQMETLLELARIRVLAAARSVRSVSVVERDLVFKAEDAKLLLEALQDAPGSVRPLTRREGDELHTVHWRPPESYLDDSGSLMTVLRKRLA